MGEQIKREEQKLPKDVADDRQLFIPEQFVSVTPFTETLKRIKLPPGSYASPHSPLDNALLSFRANIGEQIGADKAYVFGKSDYPVTDEWQTLFTYLFRSGITQYPNVNFDTMMNDEPKMYGLRLLARVDRSVTDGSTDLKNGSYCRGVSHRDLPEAYSKVVGELLERYPLTLYKNKDLIRSSIAALRAEGTHFLDPMLVAQCAEWQKEKFPARKYDEKSIFRFVKGVSLTSGKEALVPAQLVFWNYILGEREPRINQPITNGAGGMFTFEGAVLSGLYELIQRDAFLVHWLNKIPPVRIRPESVAHEGVQRLLRDCRRYQLEVHILETTIDLGAPSFVTVLIDKTGRGPAVSVGGGCGQDPEAAIERAISEGLGVRYWIRQHGTQEAMLPEDYHPFEKTLGQDGRLSLWGNPGMMKHLEFFLEGNMRDVSEIPKKTLGRPRDELAYLLGVFQKKGPGYEIFAHEAKHPVLDRLGYHSVRVCVPAIIPLYLNETFAPLGAARIKEACSVLGRTPPAEPNPIPHPFP